MAEFHIKTRETGSGWVFDVQLNETLRPPKRYTVTLTRAFYDEITGARAIAPEEVVRKSFEFLLEREPADAILRTFDLRLISSYFPEYSHQISTRF